MLKPIFNVAKRCDKLKAKTYLSKGKLYIDGQMYSAGPTSNINEINKVLNVTSTCKRSDDNVMLFLGTHSPFSNLFSADLSIDNVKYNSSEQYIQSQKAMLFDDDVTHARIMKETNQYKIKKLGSKVHKFSVETWRSVLEHCAQGRPC